MKTKKTNPKKPAATPARTKRAAAKSARAKGNAKRTETPPPSNPAKVAPVPAVAPATWRPNWIEAEESKWRTPDGVWPTRADRVAVETPAGEYRFPAWPPFPEDSTAKGMARALRSPFAVYARRVLTDCGFSFAAFEKTAALVAAGSLRYPLALDWNMTEAEARALPPPCTDGEAATRFAAFQHDTRARWQRWELFGLAVALYNSAARASRRGLSPAWIDSAALRCADDFRQVREAFRAAGAALGTMGSALPLSPAWIADKGPGESLSFLFMGETDFEGLKRLDEAERALSSTFAAALERFAGLLTGEEGAPTDAPPASPSNPATVADKHAAGAKGTRRPRGAITLEEAATRLHVSGRTLQREERDPSRVPDCRRGYCRAVRESEEAWAAWQFGLGMKEAADAVYGSGKPIDPKRLGKGAWGYDRRAPR